MQPLPPDEEALWKEVLAERRRYDLAYMDEVFADNFVGLVHRILRRDFFHLCGGCCTMNWLTSRRIPPTEGHDCILPPAQFLKPGMKVLKMATNDEIAETWGLFLDAVKASDVLHSSTLTWLRSVHSVSDAIQRNIVLLRRKLAAQHPEPVNVIVVD